MNQDERRALKILRERFPNDETLNRKFMDFIRKTKKPNVFPKPIEMAEAFILWLVENKHEYN